MHDIMNLKEMLLDELSEYGRKGELNAKTLETIDTLAHATKNLCKIIEDAEMMEESSMGGSSYDRGGNNYYDGSSYARGRGRNARRDRMGRYSRDGRGNNYENYDGNSYERGNSYRGGNNYRRGGYSRDDAKQEFAENLREMMEQAPDENARQSIQRMIQQMEQN